MESLEQIRIMLETAVPGAVLRMIENGSSAGQPSLLLNTSKALEAARFLRDDSRLRFDYLSNVTGVDWPERKTKQTVKTRQVIEGVDREIQTTAEKVEPGYLEAVYHLYSMELKHGPLIIRLRTGDRKEQTRLPSLTPIWRGAEFQEREVFDLFGIVFEGHPDLRRILMWDGFKDYPMRKDYVEPDDYEYEPTPHDEVLERAKAHQERDGR